MSARQPAISRTAAARTKAPRLGQATTEGHPEYDGLIACLEEAGATLLSLPMTGFSPALKTSTLPILREAAEAYGWSTAEVRPAMPSASRISRMDMVMGYLALIPQDRYLLRRIVGLPRAGPPNQRQAPLFLAAARRRAGRRSQGHPAMARRRHPHDHFRAAADRRRRKGCNPRAQKAHGRNTLADQQRAGGLLDRIWSPG